MMNRRGERKVLSTWLYAMLAAVGLAVIIAVGAFHGADVDAREYEAEVLSERLLDCLIENGFFIDGDIYEICSLNREVFGEEGKYYSQIIFSSGERIEVGNPSFRTDCEIARDSEADKYPKCIWKEETYVSNGFVEKLTILSASNNFGRKVSLQ